MRRRYDDTSNQRRYPDTSITCPPGGARIWTITTTTTSHPDDSFEGEDPQGAADASILYLDYIGGGSYAHRCALWCLWVKISELSIGAPVRTRGGDYAVYSTNGNVLRCISSRRNAVRAGPRNAHSWLVRSPRFGLYAVIRVLVGPNVKTGVVAVKTD